MHGTIVSINVASFITKGKLLDTLYIYFFKYFFLFCKNLVASFYKRVKFDQQYQCRFRKNLDCIFLS